MSRITDILLHLYRPHPNLVPEDYAFTNDPKFKAAEQALLALFNEAIGEDEPNVTSLLDNDTAPYIDNPVAIARNQLRAEIRKKVGL